MLELRNFIVNFCMKAQFTKEEIENLLILRLKIQE
jgi:hypothetical protein